MIRGKYIDYPYSIQKVYGPPFSFKIYKRKKKTLFNKDLLEIFLKDAKIISKNNVLVK